MFVRCVDAHAILYFVLWMLVAYIHDGDAYEQSSDKHLHSNRFHQSKPRKIDLRRYSEHVRRPTSGHHTHGAGARSFREFTQHWHGFREHKWRGFQKLQTAATHAAATHTSRKVHHAAAKVPEKVTSHWHRIKSRHDNKHRKEHLASRGITRTFGNPTVLDAHKHEPREFLGDMLEQQPFLDISEYPDTFFEFEQTYADSNAVKRTLPLNQVDVHAPDNSPSDFSLPIDDFSYGIARTIATSGVSEARHLLENEYSTEHEQRREQKNRQNSRRRSSHPPSKSIMTDEHAIEDSGTKREPTENDKDVETDEEQAEDSEPSKDAAKNNEDLRSEPSMIQVGSKRAFQLKGKSASDVAAEIENLDKEQIPILEHADTDRLPLHGHTAESEHDLKQLKSLKGLDEEGNEKKDEREDEDKKPDPEYVVSTNGYFPSEWHPYSKASGGAGKDEEHNEGDQSHDEAGRSGKEGEGVRRNDEDDDETEARKNHQGGEQEGANSESSNDAEVDGKSSEGKHDDNDSENKSDNEGNSEEDSVEEQHRRNHLKETLKQAQELNIELTTDGSRRHEPSSPSVSAADATAPGFPVRINSGRVVSEAGLNKDKIHHGFGDRDFKDVFAVNNFGRSDSGFPSVNFPGMPGGAGQGGYSPAFEHGMTEPVASPADETSRSVHAAEQVLAVSGQGLHAASGAGTSEASETIAVGMEKQSIKNSIEDGRREKIKACTEKKDDVCKPRQFWDPGNYGPHESDAHEGEHGDHHHAFQSFPSHEHLPGYQVGHHGTEHTPANVPENIPLHEGLFFHPGEFPVTHGDNHGDHYGDHHGDHYGDHHGDHYGDHHGEHHGEHHGDDHAEYLSGHHGDHHDEIHDDSLTSEEKMIEFQRNPFDPHDARVTRIHDHDDHHHEAIPAPIPQSILQLGIDPSVNLHYISEAELEDMQQHNDIFRHHDYDGHDHSDASYHHDDSSYHHDDEHGHHGGMHHDDGHTVFTEHDNPHEYEHHHLNHEPQDFLHDTTDHGAFHHDSDVEHGHLYHEHDHTFPSGPQQAPYMPLFSPPQRQLPMFQVGHGHTDDSYHHDGDSDETHRRSDQHANVGSPEYARYLQQYLGNYMKEASYDNSLQGIDLHQIGIDMLADKRKLSETGVTISQNASETIGRNASEDREKSISDLLEEINKNRTVIMETLMRKSDAEKKTEVSSQRLYNGSLRANDVKISSKGDHLPIGSLHSPTALQTKMSADSKGIMEFLKMIEDPVKLHAEKAYSEIRRRSHMGGKDRHKMYN